MFIDNHHLHLKFMLNMQDQVLSIALIIHFHYLSHDLPISIRISKHPKKAYIQTQFILPQLAKPNTPTCIYLINNNTHTYTIDCY